MSNDEVENIDWAAEARRLVGQRDEFAEAHRVTNHLLTSSFLQLENMRSAVRNAHRVATAELASRAVADDARDGECLSDKPSAVTRWHEVVHILRPYTIHSHLSSTRIPVREGDVMTTEERRPRDPFATALDELLAYIEGGGLILSAAVRREIVRLVLVACQSEDSYEIEGAHHE